ncbi:hypothetical protein B0T24DRAFT_432486 [Lasiosphaeria ovina]|uniref:Transposase IS30-like HTH domain-containing protein n=1 Tax=Lasiosphaeria ovina TaxID=92902 RepID=A0AAE0MZI9_9PEZI|nr:hypothetical protein B0T24DRAFT_107641 [Lasiosphaeria ovina]KAK3365366.1 hypothetical protein B0T24DRAFT_432486 [Lasiosphaeria ovina]
MQLQALLNATNNIHNSPCVERFYRLQTRPSIKQPLLQRSPRSAELSRDEKLQIQTLRTHTGMSKKAIARKLGKTYIQVRHALRTPVTPQKVRSGRKPLISTPLKEAIR